MHQMTFDAPEINITFESKIFNPHSKGRGVVMVHWCCQGLHLAADHARGLKTGKQRKEEWLFLSPLHTPTHAMGDFVGPRTLLRQ